MTPCLPCPVCGEELDLELEVPVCMLWDLMVGGITCLACGTGEIGVIHPSAAPQGLTEMEHS
jgi:hypothetical protein